MDKDKKKAPKFSRIRRITGYLTGETSRWNDSKKAELKNRTKHTTDEELLKKGE